MGTRICFEGGAGRRGGGGYSFHAGRWPHDHRPSLPDNTPTEHVGFYRQGRFRVHHGEGGRGLLPIRGAIDLTSACFQGKARDITHVYPKPGGPRTNSQKYSMAAPGVKHSALSSIGFAQTNTFSPSPVECSTAVYPQFSSLVRISAYACETHDAKGIDGKENTKVCKYTKRIVMVARKIPSGHM